MNILISACLLGVNCRYSGDSKRIPEVEILMKEYNLIPVCPEIMGGMATPREPAEQSGDRVFDKKGNDVTVYFKKGAEEVLKLARLFNCEYAILKERSPSCGYGKIYDGSFSGTIIDGNGVLAEMLEKEKIKIIGESRIGELLEILKNNE